MKIQLEIDYDEIQDLWCVFSGIRCVATFCSEKQALEYVAHQ